VIGELALGMLKNREEVLGSLETLPQANVATNDEVLSVIESRVLFGRGIGLIDAHLLVAAKLTRDALLWTGDVRLRAASEELGVAFKSSLYV
jgi:predicted nucleic acid-binding protein